MSITCLRVISGAMRKLGVLAIGREATAAQAEDALAILNSIYLELIGQGVFGKLCDSIISAATYEAHEGERVVCDTTVTTVTLPATITSEWWPSGGNLGGPYDYGWSWSSPIYPRPPRDGAIIEIAATDDPANSEIWLYDAPRALWAEITGLTLSDMAPLSDRYGQALQALLAIKLAPGFNVEPNKFLLKELAYANSLLSNRPDRPYRPVVGSYF